MTLKSESSAHQRLLIAASELFTRKGYSGTTVREIVAAAGVTKPVLYYYFRNKEGIYLELMRETFDKVDVLLSSSFNENGSAIQKLKHFCDQAFLLFLENIQVVRMMYSIYYGPHQGAPFFDFESYNLKIQQSIRKLVEEAVRRDEFSIGNVEEITWIILGAISVAVEVQLVHPERGINREGLERILDLIFQGLGKGAQKWKGVRR